MGTWLELLGGGVLLYFGAEWLVGGASSLALALRIPQIVVGLTVVAYGTSAPELIVGARAAASGHGIVALGNVLGSNVANVGLILGLAALVRPAPVHASLRHRDLPVLVLSALAVPYLLLDAMVTPVEGSFLLAAALGYSVWMVKAARAPSAAQPARAEAQGNLEVAGTAEAPRVTSIARSALVALVGLIVLLFGGNFFVSGAVDLARLLGVSERVVGLTVVAVGTSLPELVTSFIAAARGHSDIAVGNVVGSNIFNILLCLGAAALAGPVGAELGYVWLEVAMVLLMTALLALVIRSERLISRLEGAIALVLYISFTTYVVVVR